ncbi:Mannose-binding lectin [Plasmopara halstedii]|uniref:Mannose-binding lectin n=1 Tax=Plasmopara halstedii TaxID=4781 RepID=A0A0P1AEG2_PLAHL|nr:Mannose-binding lectin [Plasmopara halstedii]CEG39122.1 Mannose-binding lectin [Plasmopara halstedii]|eukprot:XP_024575491.1 Mannose-binding lectin [Plasmopara halstedii]
MQVFAVLQALMFVLVEIVYGATSDEDIQLSQVFGGHGGVAFSDIKSVKFGQSASTITIHAKDEITGVILRILTPADLTLSHGGCGGKDYTLVLEHGEYVNKMEIHWDKKHWRTHIFYLKFSTNKNRSVEAGTTTHSSSTVEAPEGFQLSGFFGRAEGEVYQLGVIWARMNATNKELTDKMGSAWYGDQIRNWVGPAIGNAKDSACYRKRFVYGKHQTCPRGYSAKGISCLAQCPISYPVACYEECIPQNDNCLEEILSKAASVVAAVFNVVTAGIFGAIFTSYKSAKQNFVCAANIVGAVKSLIYYLRFQSTTAPQGTVEEMLAIAYQSNVVLFDLPIAVSHCLGKEVPANVEFANVVYIIVENIVKVAIVHGDDMLSTATNVIAVLQNTSVINGTEDTTVEKLQTFLESNTTCGYQLKNLTDHVILAVRRVHQKYPSATTSDIRIRVSESSLVLQEIPIATNNCMHELLKNKTIKAAFETRDLIRRTFGVIVDQLIEGNSTDLGKSVAEADYTLEAANLALVVLSGLDPTGITWMVSQFIQPTCGPTLFVGEIDDGNLYDALGLRTMEEAFTGSYGTWTRKGDGMVDFYFESSDTSDMSVELILGAKPFVRVDVPAGTSVKWSEKLSTMQEQVLYMHRWHRTAIGLLMSNGGSLVMWVPRSSQGGHITMHVRINKS